MLTIEDCIALSALSEEEIEAIAEAQHVPEVIAVELGSYLMCQPDGKECVSAMIRDDIEAARHSGDLAHAARLRLCLQHFLKAHASRP